MQFGGPAPWTSREGVWRRRGQEVLLDEEPDLCFRANHFNRYYRYSDGINRRYCFSQLFQMVGLVSIFTSNPFQVLGESAPPPPLPPHPPSPPSTPPEGQPEMESEVELNSFLVSRHHHISIHIIRHHHPPLPQPDMEMEVALELLPILAKRSLLHNSQAASLEILQHFLLLEIFEFDLLPN